MSRRDPREARPLGLWTAAWLGGLLLAGVLRLGDLSVQWPVLLIPVLWALFALRPRGRRTVDDGWQPIPPADRTRSPAHPAQRTDTVERPALRNSDRDQPWR